MRFAHIITNNSVTVFDLSKPSAAPATFDSSHPQYHLMVDAVRSGDEDQIDSVFSVERAISKLTNGRVKVFDNNTITVDGKEIHNSINSRIIQSLADGYQNIGYMIRFLENIAFNPSVDSANELYEFLEYCDLPITPDGHFLAYKMVKNDYMDQFTRSIDNSVGQVVEMPRSEVNSNRHETCSHGLHFASLKYIGNRAYGVDGGTRLMVVKIHPSDVVSIPVDYNNSKGRCCRYEVVGELERPDQMQKNFTESYSTVKDEYVYAPTPEEPVSNVVEEPVETVSSNSVLDEDTVNEIHNLLRDEWPLASIEKVTGISSRHIARLRDNQVKAWEHLHPSNQQNKPVGEYKGTLDAAKVKEVFSLLSDGWTLRAIEKTTGVSRRHIGRLRDGEITAWNHLRPKSL